MLRCGIHQSLGPHPFGDRLDEGPGDRRVDRSRGPQQLHIGGRDLPRRQAQPECELTFDEPLDVRLVQRDVHARPGLRLRDGQERTEDRVSSEAVAAMSVLTADDLPAALGGGPHQPALVTQNVADDNGLRITDGSVVLPGNPDVGKIRSLAFPYYAAPNANPASVPTGNPPV